MSVLIKNMDMPKTCSECPIRKVCHYTPFKVTEAFKAELFMKRPEFCTLIEIPEEHGRLIDADSLRENIESFGGILPEEINTFLMILEQEKTIIESEE